MKTADAGLLVLQDWESAVAFRLFADQDEPTLSIAEQIAARMGERILGDSVAPGERIGEQEVADEFRVSRGPVRDAFRILEREGLVTLRPRHGAVVTALRPDELLELMEIRAGLFELAARKLMAARNPQFLDLMRTGTKALQTLARREGSGEAYVETTYRLLILVVRMAGNRRLQRMLTSLSLQTLRYSKLGMGSLARREQSLALWVRALHAVEQGDTEELVRLTRQRIQESAREAMRVLREKAPTQEVSTQEVSTQEASTREVSIQEVPIQEVAMQKAPRKGRSNA